MPSHRGTWTRRSHVKRPRHDLGLDSLTALDQEASSHADDAAAQTAMHFGRGQLAIARADVAGARAHFDQCSREDEMCKWQGVVAAEKVGDAAGAAAGRDQLLKIYGRDPVHLIVRSRLAPRRAT